MQRLGLILFLLACLGSPAIPRAWAQDSPAHPRVQERLRSTRVSFDFRNLAPQRALRDLAQRAGVPLVFSNTAITVLALKTGGITLRLADVSAEKALGVILDLAGLEALPRKTQLTIVPSGQADDEQVPQFFDLRRLLALPFSGQGRVKDYFALAYPDPSHAPLPAFEAWGVDAEILEEVLHKKVLGDRANDKGVFIDSLAHCLAARLSKDLADRISRFIALAGPQGDPDVHLRLRLTRVSADQDPFTTGGWEDGTPLKELRLPLGPGERTRFSEGKTFAVPWRVLGGKEHRFEVSDGIVLDCLPLYGREGIFTCVVRVSTARAVNSSPSAPLDFLRMESVVTLPMKQPVLLHLGSQSVPDDCGIRPPHAVWIEATAGVLPHGGIEEVRLRKEEIRVRLDREVASVDYRDLPFTRVVQDLTRLTGMPVRITRDAFLKIRAWEKKVNLVVQKIRFSGLLHLLSAFNGVQYWIEDQGIIFGTEEERDDQASFWRSYPVADLLYSPAFFRNSLSGGPYRGLQAEERETDPDGARPYFADELCGLLMDSVGENTWSRVPFQLIELPRHLLVRHKMDVHRVLHRKLHELRAHRIRGGIVHGAVLPISEESMKALPSSGAPLSEEEVRKVKLSLGKKAVLERFSLRTVLGFPFWMAGGRQIRAAAPDERDGDGARLKGWLLQGSLEGPTREGKRLLSVSVDMGSDSPEGRTALSASALLPRNGGILLGGPGTGRLLFLWIEE